MKMSKKIGFVAVVAAVMVLASCSNSSGGGSSGPVKPQGFVKVSGIAITGTEEWTPSSSVFVSGRSLTIPTLWVCDHEVTRGEFKAVMEKDPSTEHAYDAAGNKLEGEAALDNPVNKVSWYDAIAYCNKRSLAEGLTPCYSVSGITDWANLAYSSIPTSSPDNDWNSVTCDWSADGYRLPTEAEWEYLARGGENYKYAGSDTLGDVAWYSANAYESGSEGTRTVKTKGRNGYGLYDMTGNVWEWCWDWTCTKITAATGPYGADPDTKRMIRGGAFNLGEYQAPLDKREWNENPFSRNNNFGFRVVRAASN